MKNRLNSKRICGIHQCFGGWQIEHPLIGQCTKHNAIDTLRDQPDVKTHRIDVLACVTKPSGARAYQYGDRDTRAGKRFCNASNYSRSRCKATELWCRTNFNPANSGICCRKRIIDAVNHHFDLDHKCSVKPDIGISQAVSFPVIKRISDTVNTL